MYFDFDYYFKVLRHVWSLKGWSGRPRTLFKLLVLVPLESAVHSLFFLLDYLLFPSLWAQRVDKPIFIVGHARSGTTLAHRLLSADGDRFNDFLYWEMFFPSLLEKKLIRGLGWLDRHLLRGFCRGKLEALDDKLFGRFRHMHYMSFWHAEEDQFAMRAAFVTQQWATDIPLMDTIDLFHLDQMPRKQLRWMRYYRQIIKRQLLLNGGDKIHLSKNPVMSGWVESIIKTFPDARIIVMRRNPNECIPSLLKLMEASWQAKGWTRADYSRSLEALTETCFECFHHPHSVLAQYPATPRAIVDYREITRQPRSAVQAIYASLGIEISAEYDAYLLEQEQREKAHKTRFTYSIEEYDHLSVESIQAELGRFFDAFDWPRVTSADVRAAHAKE